MEGYLVVRKLRKAFGPVVALAGVSFSVERGEFFTLLGPSGCGKTTLLRCLAGFERAEAGEILIDGRDVRDDEPEKRDIGFVFQRYALFPTMTVAENVAFGLEVRKRPGPEIDQRVQEVLRLVGLQGLDDRKPRQLSGGQQQRVALARALVIRPRILLLDEPLSNLDAKLRVEMRMEIRRLQKDLGITAVYVTHDQEESFALSDRVLVMSQGEAQQVGTPQELYFAPRNQFVAGFIGQTNFLGGRCVERAGGWIVVDCLGARVRLPTERDVSPGAAVAFTVRPEHVRLERVSRGENSIRAVVRQVQFLGPTIGYYAQTGSVMLLGEVHGVTRDEVEKLPRQGEEVWCAFDPEDCVVMGTEAR
ncbi:MAG: ABC transporter ATP-binding protein [Candidatus Rokubacteria bacterium]|nr:ABC transporter ATP-binding protein [Candidatus Rokubacteria bacterium]